MTFFFYSFGKNLEKLKKKVNFYLPKFLTTFFSHSPKFLLFRPCPNASLLQIHKSTNTKYKNTTAHLNFLWPFFVIHSAFFIFHPCFRPSHLQTYNYNCTFHPLQLQITFYNCRNCDQLHVKICPAMGDRMVWKGLSRGLFTSGDTLFRDTRTCTIGSNEQRERKANIDRNREKLHAYRYRQIDTMYMEKDEDNAVTESDR